MALPRSSSAILKSSWSPTSKSTSYSTHAGKVTWLCHMHITWPRSHVHHMTEVTCSSYDHMLLIWQLYATHLDTNDVTVLEQEWSVLQTDNLAAFLPLFCALPTDHAPLEWAQPHMTQTVLDLAVPSLNMAHQTLNVLQMWGCLQEHSVGGRKVMGLQGNLSIEDTTGSQLAVLYTEEPLYRAQGPSWLSCIERCP